MAEPGMVFLSLWLRRGTLQSLLIRELGEAAFRGDWQSHGPTRTQRLPLGIVAHFPAANVAVQPLLSMSCGVLGGNASLVRVPENLISLTEAALQLLCDADRAGVLSGKLLLLAAPSDRHDLLAEMARGCDGAMIWGGEEAVLAVRSLPFPHWARLVVFGPRTSVAVMDRCAWTQTEARSAWCQRLARDTWQFDQRACSSPQVLYVQRDPGTPIDVLLDALAAAFEAENRAHPRTVLAAEIASSIARARAEWWIGGPGRQARFPLSPDWTVLAGEGIVADDPVQYRCLFVSVVDDLCEAVRTFDGNVQTLGLACGDPLVEQTVVDEACRRGVDRVTQQGRMHVFDSPWDGMELVAPMTRLVRYTPSALASDAA
jgi:hypothetical protein